MSGAAALYLLATLDALFIGYRDGAARCARLHKRDHIRRSLLWGALWGQLAVLIAAAAIALTLAWSPDTQALFAHYNRAAWCMVSIYAPYATVLLIALLVRLVPSVDARSLAAVLVFGPLHFLRPFVVLCGALWAAYQVPQPAVIAIITLASVMMLSLERVLDGVRRRRAKQRVP